MAGAVLALLGESASSHPFWRPKSASTTLRDALTSALHVSPHFNWETQDDWLLLELAAFSLCSITVKRLAMPLKDARSAGMAARVMVSIICT